MCKPVLYKILFFSCIFSFYSCVAQKQDKGNKEVRERISINEGWKFYKYAATEKPDSLIYDVRPDAVNEDGKAADAEPTMALQVKTKSAVLKSWIMPSGNSFIKDTEKHYTRPVGKSPGNNFPFVQGGFNDAKWQEVNLPHDWAVQGPFYKGWDTEVGGGMGRLPSQGVAWYRRKLDIPATDKGKNIYLDIDGAMSYAMVWLNGQLVGGWPYGYASWRVDLTPYIIPGGENQLAIRIDNPLSSSRWYPGGGIYRSVWLVKTGSVHVAHWGTYVTTPIVSAASATVKIEATIENTSAQAGKFDITTAIYGLDANGNKEKKAAATAKSISRDIAAGKSVVADAQVTIANPKLWGPPPTQKPNRYVAVTSVYQNGRLLDVYETPFGIRSLEFDAEKGLFVNGEKIIIKGANQHHDLGALGAAFNERAAERQLELLGESGCNAIRLAHNPPAPELLDMLDRMGFLVVDEVFDCWERKKTSLDFHLIFPEWSEQDLRAMLRRDRNHPGIILWSFGNEVGEQYTGEAGAAVAERLKAIIKEEDTTRPVTVSMNYAKPDMPLPAVVDVISLNYQGEGIRNGGAYAGLKGITTPPLFPAFHEKFPGKMIISSENAAAVSSRGKYYFPVAALNSAPVKDNAGGNPTEQQVSAYELYSVDFGSSADKVFATMDGHPYVAGGFVWSGWDYLGEPTPYYLSRSSYFGFIDLAGFKKDRFYLYQSYWAPEKPMAHLLPHWNWPERVGQVTPVHVFTSGDEAELFLNGKSLGKKKKGALEYRIRWDDVVYTPGELKVVAYKNGKRWVEDRIATTGSAYKIELVPDRAVLNAAGSDLSFITVKVTDKEGNVVPDAANNIRFYIEGDGEIVATDNGDSANLVPFPSHERAAFSGLCLVIVKPKNHKKGSMTVKAVADGLQQGSVVVKVK
ncbi:beta-galactosidase GalB [Flavobacterium sp. RHBU_3]|uniref:beta-galactosidase GalB n=1 Tax=Flavobacterium sp. RHBU_3 TaxID=3391184 RepID=UPI003984BD2D